MPRKGVLHVEFPHQKEDAPKHGTLTRYNNPFQCRCDECQAAKAAADASRRKKGEG
jgi:hypothetical protein